MKVRNILAIAIVSALLAACSSSGGSSSGGGNGIRPNASSSINTVSEPYRSTVSEKKTISLTENKKGEIEQITLGGQTGEYNFSNLPNGRTDLPISEVEQDAKGTTTYSGTLLVYQQPYSVVTGRTYTQGSGPDFKPHELNVFDAKDPLGLATPAPALTTLTRQNAIFNYQGKAFDGQEEATLNYTMDFGSKKGSGTITGFTRTGKIDLLESGPLGMDDGYFGVSGKVYLEKDPNNPNVKYELDFFGPNAEEIAGDLDDDGNLKGILGDSEIIFAGQKTSP